MRRTAGAVLVRFEQLPEEAGNAIEERRNAALMANVVAICGRVGLRRIDRLVCFSSATVAFSVIVGVGVAESRNHFCFNLVIATRAV